MHTLFDKDKNIPDLKNRSIRGGVVTLGGQIINQLIQIGITMILARLLSPKEFGLLAMVTSIIGFVLLFKDLGLVEATVQREHITHEQISTLFWINIGISVLLMVAVIAIAPLLAWYYHEPQLYWITIALSFGFILGGSGVQHEALLRRNMHFRVIVIRDLLSTVGGGIVGIILACMGVGVWSLVCMALTKNLLQSITVWTACNWWPGLPRLDIGSREMLTFGRNLTLFTVINYFARNVDHILIGRYLGAGPLAMYSKAYGLLTLPLRQINVPVGNVAIPTLSRLQDQPEMYRRYYLKIIQIIGYLAFPTIIALAVLSKEIILIVLGSQWIDASPIFMILSFAALGQVICNSTGWVYVSLNQTARMARWGFISSPIICLSFVIGLPWGIKGIAISYTMISIFLVHFNFKYCFKYSPISIKDIYFSLIHPAILSLIVAVSMLSMRFILKDLHPGWITLLSISTWFLSIGVVLCLMGTLRNEIIDIYRILSGAVKIKEKTNIVRLSV